MDSRRDSLQKVLLSGPAYLICQERLVASAAIRFPCAEERLVAAPADSRWPDVELGRVLLDAD